MASEITMGSSSTETKTGVNTIPVNSVGIVRKPVLAVDVLGTYLVVNRDRAGYHVAVEEPNGRVMTHSRYELGWRPYTEVRKFVLRDYPNYDTMIYTDHGCSDVVKIIGIPDTLAIGQSAAYRIRVVNDELHLHGPMSQADFDAKVMAEVEKQVATAVGAALTTARLDFERELLRIREAAATPVVKPKRKYVRKAKVVATAAEPVTAEPKRIMDEYEDDVIILTEVRA